MDIILLDRVDGLGQLGDRVSVKSGYARNFLIPKGKATEATPAKIEQFEKRRAEFEKAQQERLAASQTRADQLSGKVFVVASKAGDEGKLFGSVGTQHIVDAAKAIGLDLERHEVLMPNGTIREIGEYPITLKLYGDIHVDVTVRVIVAD